VCPLCPGLEGAVLLGKFGWGARILTPSDQVPATTDQAAEIARLRRELDRTRMERDVLKKAIGIFAEMPK